MLLQPPKLLHRLFPDILWNIRDSGKSLFLTFDDGPDPEVTPKVLAILNRYQVKATFFCLGHQAKKYPQLVNALRKDGHTIGNHGFEHLDGWKTNTGKYIENAERADEYISSRLFRPPYGRISLSQLHRLKKRYQIVMWDVMSYDFKAPISTCYQIVTGHSNNGSVIVFHDIPKTKNTMLGALEKSITYFREQGFQFRAIGN